MLNESFKTNIEENSARIMENNPLLAGARAGTLTRPQIQKYLFNLMYFFHHTPIHLERAKARAEKMGMDRLAQFFDEKIREETGHEVWAQNDLKGDGTVAKQADLSQINAGTLRLLAHAKDVIDENPALFIPYMLFMEYFTVIAAPEFLANLENKCDWPRSMMTAIGYHAELDKDHVQDDFDVLSWCFNDMDGDAMMRAMRGTMKHTEEMLAECVTNYC